MSGGALTRYRFHTADVFTDRIFGGNPLAVFADAEGLDTELMQQIAAEFNLSETAFVLPPRQPQHHCQLRIFTPTAELPFAGHPTIGTAIVLASIGAIELQDDHAEVIFEEEAGAVAVSIQAGTGVPAFARLVAPQPPEFRPSVLPDSELARVLSLQEADLLDAPFQPEAVSCGVPLLFVGLKNRAALARVRLDDSAWKELLADSWAPQVYCFTFDPEREGSHVRSRMFGPGLGIPEDPATGGAAAPLAAYLAARDTTSDGTLVWVIEQGFEMGRPSILVAEAEKRDGQITALRVGGNAVIVSSGEMSVPDAVLGSR